MSHNGKIRVMIVDDHAVVRSGLATFLMTCDDIEMVGEASNGEKALKLCSSAQPDVVLMDLVMPVMDGAAATRLLREQHPETQVIVLTSFKDEGLVQKALQAGAISYLLKDVSSEDLTAAIQAAYAGRSTLAPEAAQALIQAARHPADRIGFDLTSREHEVLDLLVEGMNNNEIADRLVISPSTAKFHVSSILSKLGASTRTEAARIAWENHLVG
jgi:NarL family two-component system response regulator LiaR